MAIIIPGVLFGVIPSSPSDSAADVSTAGVGAVGTYVYGMIGYPSVSGEHISGADIKFSGVGAQQESSGAGTTSMLAEGSTLAGSWVSCGNAPAPSGYNKGATLFYRISAPDALGIKNISWVDDKRDAVKMTIVTAIGEIPYTAVKGDKEGGLIFESAVSGKYGPIGTKVSSKRAAKNGDT